MNTACSATKAKKTPPLLRKKLKYKIAKTEGGLAPEPLLHTNPHCFVLFPIQHPNIWQMYKKAKASFWTTKEIDLFRDTADWDKLSTTKQHFISHVLAFFMASDGIVNKNLSSNFATEVTLPEARCFYGFKLQSRISTAKHTHSLSTRTSRIQPRRITCSVQSKRCPASNTRHSGLSNGVMLPLPALWTA